MNPRLLCTWLLALCGFGAAHAAVELDVSGGTLNGARNVNVNGTLYDVSFQDGTCIDIFGGCDALSDLAFGGSNAAFAASQALLDQVFIDGPSGNFDSNPALTRGCADNTGQGFCAVFTPVDIQVNNILAQNTQLESGDLVRAAFTLNGENLLIYDTVVYARWSVQTPVPEPESWILALAGVAGVGWLRRRQRGICAGRGA